MTSHAAHDPLQERRVEGLTPYGCMASTPPSSFPSGDEAILLEALERAEAHHGEAASPTDFSVYVDPPPPSAVPLSSSPPAQSVPDRTPAPDDKYLDGHAYRAISFGDWGTYMRHKRAKLHVQEQAILEEEAGTCLSQALRGCVIYINGRTEPPYAELRRLIVLHGGTLMAYLDQKKPCTHIVASALTPKKCVEFQAYRVVLPAWIVDSCAAGRAQDWTKYRIPGHQRPGLWSLWGDQATTSSAQKAEASPPGDQAVPTATASRKNVDVHAPHAEEDVAPPPEAAHAADAAPGVPTKEDEDEDQEDEALSMPAYASQPHQRAAQLLSSASWRAQHTAASRDFLAGYYAHSRLHHLSTWKASLQDLVTQAMQDSGAHDIPATAPRPRLLMHVDFDSFFVSVGLRDEPALQSKPVAVCHASHHGVVSSTSEVASCNYHARAHGLRNGMSLRQAKHLCPSIVTIPYTFDAYYAVSLQFYTILLQVAEVVQVVSIDEALLDVTSIVASLTEAHQQGTRVFDAHPTLCILEEAFHASTQPPAIALGDALRALLRQATRCEASVGIGANILQARLATRRAKPQGTFHLTAANVASFMHALDVRDVWGVGQSLASRFAAWLGTTHIGTILARTTEEAFVTQWGPKQGRTLWRQFHGLDTDVLQGLRPRQSVGTHVSWGVRLQDEAELRQFVQGLCDEVMQRLQRTQRMATHVSISVMQKDPSETEASKFLGHGLCLTHHRSMPRTIDHVASLFQAVWLLWRKLDLAPSEVRGFSIHLSKLVEPPRGTSDLRAWVTKASASVPAPLPRATLVDTEAACHEEEVGMSSTPSSDSMLFHVPSQLEWSVVAHLPTPMRERIEAVVAERQTPSTPRKRSTPSRSPSVTPHRRRSPSESPSKQTRLGAYFASPTRRRGKTEVDVRTLGWDPDVFASLPPDIQADVLAEAQRSPRRRAAAPPRRAVTMTKAAARRQAALSALQHEARIRAEAGADRETDPILWAAARAREDEAQGLASTGSLLHVAPREGRDALAHRTLDDLRAQLRQWYTQHATQAPRYGDVAYIHATLVSCVERGQLDKVRGALLYWRFLLLSARPTSLAHEAQAWLDAYESVAASLHALVDATWHASLAD